ncbi:sensor histidine kinase [Rufibacter roseolus]|uniref:sensor histidine kinase n=1 Tax=Rufibacter roseolus TaxID=2817375 RepID=UPI001B30B580|nr:histidine kinase [Rufibacter roseolus]
MEIKKLFNPTGSLTGRASVMYWVAYVLLFGLVQGLPSGRVGISLINELISLLPKVLFVELITGPLMDRLFFGNRRGAFLVGYVSLLLLFAGVLRIIDNYLILPYFLTDYAREPLLSIPPFLYNVLKLQFVVTLPFCLKLFHQWAAATGKVQEIQTEKVQAELDYLRGQFHPHFLFNVLNGLYAKILEKSDQSAEIVLKISELLRFSVYQVPHQRLRLTDEITYLRNYIFLQKLRFEDRLDICFSVSGEVEGKYLEPFLIQPFLENSFKYCLDNDLGTGWIKLNLAVEHDKLNVVLENSLPSPSDSGSVLVGQEGSSRFGLRHVKKRLEMLYPHDHELLAQKKEESFSIHLTVRLHGPQ